MTSDYKAAGGVEAVRQRFRKLVRNARDKNKWRKLVRFRLWMPVALQLILIIGLVWYTNSRFEGFLNETNIYNILILALPLVIAAVAQTHAILVGYLDLSVGAMISLGVVLASFLIGAQASVSQILTGTGAILAAGLLLGLVNAGLIRGVKIPSIIATLATLSILNGIALTMRPTAQGIISPNLVAFLTTTVGPIPVAFIVVLVGAVLLDLWLHASGSGLEVRAVGFDETAAKRGGIRTNWIRIRALLLAGLLAAIASFFVMARSPIGNAQVGSAFALNSITAAVLGGASLAGGRATFVGSSVAAVLLALIITVLPFLGLGPDDGLIIIGVLVLIGIILFQVGDLKELGVTAIELMPVAQFPGKRNWGYDGVHPFAVQNTYGGPAGLKRLVDAAHSRGLAVVMDVVYNHIGPEGNYLAEFGHYFLHYFQHARGTSLGRRRLLLWILNK